MWQGGDELQKMCERQVVKNLGNCFSIRVGGLTDILKASVVRLARIRTRHFQTEYCQPVKWILFQNFVYFLLSHINDIPPVVFCQPIFFPLPSTERERARERERDSYSPLASIECSQREGGLNITGIFDFFLCGFFFLGFPVLCPVYGHFSHIPSNPPPPAVSYIFVTSLFLVFFVGGLQLTTVFILFLVLLFTHH